MVEKSENLRYFLGKIRFVQFLFGVGSLLKSNHLNLQAKSPLKFVDKDLSTCQSIVEKICRQKRLLWTGWNHCDRCLLINTSSMGFKWMAFFRYLQCDVENFMCFIQLFLAEVEPFGYSQITRCFGYFWWCRWPLLWFWDLFLKSLPFFWWCKQ